MQKTEGFAHFLKTHTSPNHNRVTAGGRIVPMENTLAPPRFALSASKVNQNTSSAQRIIEPVSRSVRVDTAQFADDSNNFSSSNKNNIFGYHTETSNALVPAVAHGLLPPCSSTIYPQQAALESDIMQQNQLISYGQGLGSGTFYPAVTGMTSQTPIFVQQYPVSSPYLPFAAPLVQPTVAIHDLPQAYDTAPSSVSELQASLSEAKHSFEVYEQQLRDFDRFRATHARHETVSAQRMHIASLRNVARNEIQRIEAALKTFHERPASQQHSVQQQNVGALPLEIKKPNPSKYETTKAKSASKLNVAAAAYVPRAANPPTATERGLTKFSAAQYSKNNNITGSPEQKRVDKWGNRLGDPPPQLLQEQRLQAEHILSKLNAPQTSDDDASENDSAQSSGSTNSRLDPQHRAPPAMEAEYERLLDAMRKPIGTTTPVLMTNGRMKVVAGIDLKPQPIEQMTNFEIAYWKRKPSDPDYLGHGGKENSRAPSLIAKTSTLSFESSVLSQNQAKTYRGNLQGWVLSPDHSFSMLTRETAPQVAKLVQKFLLRSDLFQNPLKHAHAMPHGARPYVIRKHERRARAALQPNPTGAFNQNRPLKVLVRRLS